MQEALSHLGFISAGAGIGLSVLGMGAGVGLIFAAAIQSIARQPEMEKRLTGLMWVGMALIEGTALLGIIVCWQALKP